MEKQTRSRKSAKASWSQVKDQLARLDRQGLVGLLHDLYSTSEENRAYTLPDHIERLRSRGLSAKQSLAAREFALGVEGLERFARREPLRRVHECVAGVLALESEPVNPRL